MSTGWVTDELLFWHDTGNGAHFVPSGPWVEPMPHADSPVTKRRLWALVERSGLGAHLTRLAPVPATEPDLLRLHTAAYVEKVRALSAANGGEAGIDAMVGRGSYEIAQLSAGAAYRAVNAVLRGEVDNAYALCRPAGHHALADLGIGMCVFANVALAILRAREEHRGRSDRGRRLGRASRQRHPGRVLRGSVGAHDLAAPGRLAAAGLRPRHGERRRRRSGRRAQRPAACRRRVGRLPVGDGAGRPAGPRALRTGARDRRVGARRGCVRSARPHAAAHSEAYRAMTAMLLEASGGRLAMCHEGGYDAAYVPFCVPRP